MIVRRDFRRAVAALTGAVADWTRSGGNAIVRRRAKRVDFHEIFRAHLVEGLTA
jgi:hypothetical protein